MVDPKVRRAVEMVSTVDETKMLDAETVRLEHCLQNLPEGSEERSLAIRGLNIVYPLACRMVKAAADAMGYGPMEAWRDTAPISAVCDLHPILWGTDWQQRMLGQVLMPVNHPWYALPTET